MSKRASRNGTITVAFLSVLLVLSLGVPYAMAQSPQMGGTLRVAIIGEPPSLDHHFPVGILASAIAQHLFEGLFTMDSNFRPIPSWPKATA